MARNLSLKEDEILAENVRKFPCIYDKADKGHKERDMVQNAWEKVVEQIDFLKTVVDAKSHWEN